MSRCPHLHVPIAEHSDLDDCRLPPGKDCPYPEMSCYDTDKINPFNENGEPIGVGSREVRLMDLSKISTCYLVNELAKREGVEEIIIGPDETYCVGRDDDGADTVPTGGNGGPAQILVVID